MNRTRLLLAAMLSCGPTPALAVAIRVPATQEDAVLKSDIAFLVKAFNDAETRQKTIQAKHQQWLLGLPRDPANIKETRRLAREKGKELSLNLAALEEARLKAANDAIAKTIKLYGLDPEGTFDRDGNPRGKLTASYSDFLYHQWTDASGTHAQEGRPDLKHLGMTWGDATIAITRRAFRSPGILAAVIVHERVHVDQMEQGTGEAMSAYERERQPREAVLTDKAKAALGLTPADVKVLEDAFKDFMANPGFYVPMPSTPGKKPPGVRGFGEFALDAEAIQALQRESGQLYESVTAQRDRRALQGVAENRAAARAVGSALAARAAGACGLYPAGTGERRYRNRYGKDVILRYADEDGFRVALLLANACQDWGASNPLPCNDGMDAVKRRWSDGSFRKGVMPAVGSDDESNRCMWRMEGELKAGSDYARIMKISRAARTQWAQDNPPQSSPQAPEPPREPREPREPRNPAPRPPDYNPCIHDRCID